MDLKLTTTRAVPLDPRDHWEQTGNQIATMRCRDLSPDLFADIIKSPWVALDATLARIFKSGTFNEAEAAFNAFDSELMAAVGKEYERARKAAGNGIDDAALAALAAHGWVGRIVDHYRGMLQPGERHQSAEYTCLVTNQRRLSRDEIKHAGRMVTETNDENFERQFLSDHAVAELAAEAGKRERESEYPWSGNRNTDFGPRGIRQ